MATPTLVRSTFALLGIAALAVGLTACAPEISGRQAVEHEARSPSVPSESPTPTEPTESAEPWERFTDERFTDSFELPPGWSARERPTEHADEGLYKFDVLDETGAEQLFFTTREGGLGGMCPTGVERFTTEELDAEVLELEGYAPPTMSSRGLALTDPHFSYRASQLSDRVITSMSLVNDEPPSNTCLYYNLLRMEPRTAVFADRGQVNSSLDSADQPRTFADMNEARAFMDTEEYRTLKLILLSYRIQ